MTNEYFNEVESRRRADLASKRDRELVLAAIKKANEAVSALNDLIDSVPEDIIINNNFALRYYLGRAGQDSRQRLGSGVPLGHKKMDIPAATSVDREELRKEMRANGFTDGQVYARFPLLPYEKLALKPAVKTAFEKFSENFYKQQAKAAGKTVEAIASNYRFQELARQSYELSIEDTEF